QRGDSSAAPVLGSASEDHAQVGVPTGDHVRKPEAEFVAAAVAENDTRMVAAIETDRVVKIGNDHAMRIIRHLGHLEHSSGQLVAIPSRSSASLNSSRVIMRPWSAGPMRRGGATVAMSACSFRL